MMANELQELNFPGLTPVTPVVLFKNSTKPETLDVQRANVND